MKVKGGFVFGGKGRVSGKGAVEQLMDILQFKLCQALLRHGKNLRGGNSSYTKLTISHW